MGNALILAILCILCSGLSFFFGYAHHKKTTIAEKLRIQQEGYRIGYTAGYIDATASKLAAVKIENKLEE